MKYINSENDMLNFAADFSKLIGEYKVIYLHGNLGAGKTTFVRGVLQGLGYDSKVKSPTYSLVESYNINNINMHHFDLYRVGDPEELECIGIRDYFDMNSIVFIEWPEKGRDFLPLPDIDVYIEYSKDNSIDGRKVTVKRHK